MYQLYSAGIPFLEVGIPGKVKKKENGIATSTKIQYVESTKHMYLKTESEVSNIDLAVLTE